MRDLPALSFDLNAVLDLVRPKISSGVLLNRFPSDFDDDEEPETEPNDAEIKGLFAEMQLLGATAWDTGCFRLVVWFGDEWVLKFSLDTSSTPHSMAEVARLENTPDSSLFPETHHLGEGILLQANWPWSENKYAAREGEIRADAERLGLSETSLHHWNVGWRGDEYRFIDFAL